jgi:hypothetical protein
MNRRQADALLELVASGQTLSEACRCPGMPSRTTVYNWLDADEEFARRYERSLERAGDAVADYAHHLAASTTRETASANRVILDALKWRASRLNSRYAQPSGADGAPDDDVPRVDVAAARATLLARFDEVAERIEAHERERFFVSHVIANAVRELEARQRLDLLDEDDRALIVAAVRRALAPAFVPASGFYAKWQL